MDNSNNQHSCSCKGNEHGKSCGCHGHDHDKEHGCCHGHHDHHDHSEHQCSHDKKEGCTSHGCGSCCGKDKLTLNDLEKSVLVELLKSQRLPVCSFVMCSSKEKDAKFNALSPVFIEKSDDDMELVKERGNILMSLEEKSLIDIDYDEELPKNYYDIYETSALFNFFKDAVSMGKDRPGFLCDIAVLEKGILSLTEYGKNIAQIVEKE